MGTPPISPRFVPSVRSSKIVPPTKTDRTVNAQRVYRGNFGGWSDVVSNFQISRPAPEPEFIWAEYDVDGYEGSATVVFRKDGKWFAVYGSHCSCHGLEYQWDPEPLDVKLHLAAVEDGRSLITYGATAALNTWLSKRRIK